MTTIFWAGDSTVKQNSILTYPQTGIGQLFDRFTKRYEVLVENHAENGRSTKSFLDEGRLVPIYDRMTEGDFLFIQFGHNDEKRDDPARYTDPATDFCQNLEKFINAARNKGAIPVLITPVSRRTYRDTTAAFTHDAYAEAMRQTAKRLDVALVDLTRMSENAINGWSDEESKTYFMNLPAGVYPHFPDGLTDNTHLQPKGALYFGSLIAKRLHELGGVYAALLCDEYDQWCEETKQ